MNVCFRKACEQLTVAWIMSLVIKLVPVNSRATLTFLRIVDQVIVSEEFLQETNTRIYQVNLSQSLAEINVTVAILGSENFEINSSDLSIYNREKTSAGRYTLNILVYDLDCSINSPIVGSVVIDVIPPADQSCSLQLFGNCSQLCVQSNSSSHGYICSCATGYILEQDGLTCLASDPLPSILVISDASLWHLDLLSHKTTPVASINVDKVDFLYDENVILFSESSQHNSNIVMVENGEKTVFLDLDQEVVGGLAINWVDKSVLYTDIVSGVIKEVGYQTKDITVLVTSLNQPKDLIFFANSNKKLLFWIEGETGSNVIRQSYSNGSEIVDVLSSLVNLVDLSLDIPNEQLYWLTADSCVCSSSFNGSGIDCFYCFKNESVFGLAVFEIFIYVSLGVANAVVQLQKSNGEVNPSYNVYYENIPRPGDLIVFHPLKQPSKLKDVTDCQLCQQLCIVQSNRVSCDCSPGYQLSNDGHSCSVDEISEIVLSQSITLPESTRGNIIIVSSSGRLTERIVDTSYGPSQNPITGLVYAMDYDAKRHIIYFGDRNSSTLWSVSLTRLQSGHDDRHLLLNDFHAWDIAFDWINGLLYWTDDRNGTVSYVNLHATGQTSVTQLRTGLGQPRGLAINPFDRWLYCVQFDSPKIFRFHLDNEISQTLIGSDLISPTGLVIDYISSTLYWSQASGKIEKASLDGSNREIVQSNPLTAPFKLSIYKRFLIWIDNQANIVNFLDLQQPNVTISIKVIPSSQENKSLNGILIVGSNKQLSPGNYVCITNTMGCSHFCDVSDQGRTFCTCPQNYNLSTDGNICSYQGFCPVCSGLSSCSVQGSNFACSCPPGYSGPVCDQICMNGSFGQDCAQECSCVNGAICDPVHGGCTCSDGFIGSNCEEAVCSEVCANGGTCVIPDLCDCPPTFSGASCEQRICTSDYCFNGGTCFEDFGIGLSCRCPSITSGARCQFQDTIFIPQSGNELGAAVGVPLGLIITVSLITVAIGLGVFYCTRSTHTKKLKTEPLKDEMDARSSDSFKSIKVDCVKCNFNVEEVSIDVVKKCE